MDDFMNSSIDLRSMTEADLPFADSVRALAGWNQTPEDWRRFLAMEPNGCFVAAWEGALAGTATTLVYGPELAWIGMVLVHPAFRRRGIGRALLEHCLTVLQARGIQCIKLDATPLGKTVYDQLGFKEEWMLSRWSSLALSPQPEVLDPEIRAWQEEDHRRVESLDFSSFGASRQCLLQLLVSQSLKSLVLGIEKIAAFGMIRRGSRALYLGPVVATSTSHALRLIESLLSQCENKPVFWDIPDHQEEVVKWAQLRGFTRQRPLLRMYWGPNSTPGDPRRQFALAGPEVG
jgi:GNAT superfamily N-acetyltransferase